MGSFDLNAAVLGHGLMENVLCHRRGQYLLECFMFLH